MNKIMISGNISKAPETKQIGENTVTTFNVAVNEGWGDKKHTIWFKVDVWGKKGEFVQNYGEVGRHVDVIGRLKADPATGNPRTYQGKNGIGASFEVTGEDVELGPRKDGANDGNGAPAAKAQPSRKAAVETYNDDFGPDEIPF